MDTKKLETEVLPKYFRHSKFQSLVRQLNFYSFRVSKNLNVFNYLFNFFYLLLLLYNKINRK